MNKSNGHFCEQVFLVLSLESIVLSRADLCVNHKEKIINNHSLLLNE